MDEKGTMICESAVEKLLDLGYTPEQIIEEMKYQAEQLGEEYKGS